MSSSFQSVSALIPHKFPSGKILLAPAVFFAAVSVATLPVFLGIMTVGLPLFLPVLISVLTVVLIAVSVGTGVYLSSLTGRKSTAQVLGPIITTFFGTNTGQQLLYETGPRPSPVDLAETILPTDMIGQLIVSLTIDFIGSSSYLLPFVGEFSDVSWAPIQTILLMAMYDRTSPSLKYISFIEEIMPFTDVLPSGTLGWVRRYSPSILEESLKKIPDNIKSIVTTP